MDTGASHTIERCYGRFQEEIILFRGDGAQQRGCEQELLQKVFVVGNADPVTVAMNFNFKMLMM